MYSQEGCFELVKLSLGTRDLDNNGLFLSWHSFFQSKIFSCDDLESCGQISNMNMLEKPRFSLKKKAAAIVINLLLSEQKTVSNTLINPFWFSPLHFQNLTLLQDHLVISSDYHKSHCLLDHSATQATFFSLYFSTWKIGQDFWKCVYKCLNDWHFYIASCVSAILWKEHSFLGKSN